MSGIEFNSLSEFLQMGGYALHVWLVYLMFAVFFSYNLIAPRIQKRQFIRMQKRRAARDAEEINRMEASTKSTQAAVK